MDVSREKLEQTYSGKSDGVLLDLHAAGDLMDVAYEVLEEQLTKRGLAVPPRPETAPEDKAKFTAREFWEGKGTLKEAFWGVWIFGGFLAFVVLVVVTAVLVLLTGDSAFAQVVPYAVWLAVHVCLRVCLAMRIEYTPGGMGVRGAGYRCDCRTGKPCESRVT